MDPIPVIHCVCRAVTGVRRNQMVVWLSWVLACSRPLGQRIEQDPCDVAFLPAEGAREHEVRATDDPIAVARIRIREARITADPGFDTLAELALQCALARDPSSLEAGR